MLFKKLFKSSLGAVVISGILGVSAAYNGLGVWALVIQQIANQVSISIIMWFNVQWRPKLLFSFSRVKNLFSFGWKLLASSLLNVFYLEIRTLFIGRLFSSSALGFYNRGEQFPKLIVNNINGSIQSVMLPALSAYQNNRKRAKEMMRRAIVTSSFLIFPMMIGMAVIAEPLVRIVLTEKWLPAVPFLQIFSISYALIPIHTANLQAINAMGRSDIFLKLEIIKKGIGIVVLIFSIPYGVYAIAIGQVISGIIATFINAYPNKELLKYSYKEQLIDILPSLFISVLMGGIVYSFNFLNISYTLILLLQIFGGVLVYIILAKMFKVESYGYLIETITQLFKSRKRRSN
jgi:O-antigen/teichoic acid export membrane protein